MTEGRDKNKVRKPREEDSRATDKATDTRGRHRPGRAADQPQRRPRNSGPKIRSGSVRLEHPIKEIGVYDVIVHLHAEVESQIKVWVVQQKPE